MLEVGVIKSNFRQLYFKMCGKNIFPKLNHKGYKREQEEKTIPCHKGQKFKIKVNGLNANTEYKYKISIQKMMSK